LSIRRSNAAETVTSDIEFGALGMFFKVARKNQLESVEYDAQFERKRLHGSLSDELEVFRHSIPITTSPVRDHLARDVWKYHAKV